MFFEFHCHSLKMGIKGYKLENSVYKFSSGYVCYVYVDWNAIFLHKIDLSVSLIWGGIQFFWGLLFYWNET